MKIVDKIHSVDGMATKYLQETDDGYIIETAYVDYYNKHIICFSSLIGCPIGCRFCISGQKLKYIRKLTADEIITQCLNVINDNDTTNKPLLFSAMGEGEPLLNIDNLKVAFELFDSWFLGSKFSVSTSGIDTRKIKELSLFKQAIKLQLSLHSAFDADRKKLIPNSSPLMVIHDALRVASRRIKNIEINYILIHNINDSMRDLEGLCHFVNGTDWKIKINRFNSFPDIPFEQSKRLNLFIKILKARGVDVEYYETNGTDIGGACGQMSYANSQKKKASTSPVQINAHIDQTLLRVS